MKRIAEKVVLVAHICITFVFALLTVLYVTKLVPLDDVADNNIVLILLLVLAAVYVALSIYLLYVTFSEKVNVKRILLYYDSGSETRAKASVVENIVRGCAKKVKQIKVQKTKIRLDDKQGLIATIYVKVSADSMKESIERLRVLLVDNFRETLGLTFNSINFEVSKLTKKFVPDAKSKKQQSPAAQPTPVQPEPVEELKAEPAQKVELDPLADLAEQPKTAPIELQYRFVDEDEDDMDALDDPDDVDE